MYDSGGHENKPMDPSMHMSHTQYQHFFLDQIHCCNYLETMVRHSGHQGSRLGSPIFIGHLKIKYIQYN